MIAKCPLEHKRPFVILGLLLYKGEICTFQPLSLDAPAF